MARKTATHWVIPGAAAAVLHALALYIGVSNAHPSAASISAATPGLALVALELPAELEQPAEWATKSAEVVVERELVGATAEHPGASLHVGPRSLQATRHVGPPAKSATKLPAVEAAPERSPASPASKGAAASASSEKNDAASADEFANAGRELTAAATHDADAYGTAGHCTAGHCTGAHSTAAHSTAAHGFSGANLHSSAPLAAKPRLLSSGGACQGVLHSTALSTPTKVTLVLHVGKDGSASATAVRADASAHVPGLELAAQRCAQRLRFSPARDHDGAAVAASSVVKLTFSNHYTATLPGAAKPRHGAI